MASLAERELCDALITVNVNQIRRYFATLPEAVTALNALAWFLGTGPVPFLSTQMLRFVRELDLPQVDLLNFNFFLC